MVWIQPSEPFRFLPLWNPKMIPDNEMLLSTSVESQHETREETSERTVTDPSEHFSSSELDLTSTSPISSAATSTPIFANVDENTETKTLMNEAFNSTLSNVYQQQLIEKIRSEAKFIYQIGLTPTKVS